MLYSLLQSKMEDHLDEAINVLQRHASGQGGPGLAEMQSLLSSTMGLPPGFTTAALGLASRLPGLVSWMNSLSVLKVHSRSKQRERLICSLVVDTTNVLQDYLKPDIVKIVVLKLSGHLEDSGLPSAGGLLHGHQSPASVQPGSQPTGEPFSSFSSFYFLPVCHHWTCTQHVLAMLPTQYLSLAV